MKDLIEKVATLDVAELVTYRNKIVTSNGHPEDKKVIITAIDKRVSSETSISEALVECAEFDLDVDM